MPTDPTEAIIDSVDHLVLTVRSLEATCAFYNACLGMTRVDTPNSATALHFGTQKINLHQTDRYFEPKPPALRRALGTSV